MRLAETTARLAEFTRRGPGTDAERRAARWLETELQTGSAEAVAETFWCRPNWAFAHAWHVGLGLAGSLLAVSSPKLGGALILVALLSVIVDNETGLSLGRRLTPERASQNVIVSTPQPDPDKVRLIITAPYDAPRRGIVHRDAVRTVSSRLRAATGGRGPGWLAWICIALVWLLVVAILRDNGAKGTAIGVAQFPPTVGLVLALALLVELATADYEPGTRQTASAAGIAIALARALQAGPPGHLEPELVLQGAGPDIGLRRYLRARKEDLGAANTVVIGIAPTTTDHPQWWLSDGPLIPLRYFAALTSLCAEVAAGEPHLQAGPTRSRGTTPALRARAARLPAISIGGGPATLEFGLILADAIDAYVARRRPRATTPA